MPSDPQQTAADAPFYVTTPIYYVNARPHIGHAYTTLVADTVARRQRLLGRPTFFLTGTDEHGQKIERSAAAAGIPPQQFTDQVSASFRQLWDRMGITYSDYIRTTEPRHRQGVQHLFQQLQNNGAIYKGTYTGQYCVSDEAYVDGPPGIHCPDCGRLTETVSESNYYFKLSAFQRPLLDLIESNTLLIQPDSRRNEVLSFLCGAVIPFLCAGETIPAEEFDRRVKNGIETNTIGKTPSGTLYVVGALKDLSISRTSFRWGIPVPGDEEHVIYVWLDALANYMTALGYGEPEHPLFDQFWPADLHLVGKEIIRFHCIYWPAFLLALNPDSATSSNAGDNPSLLSFRGTAEEPASAPAPGQGAPSTTQSGMGVTYAADPAPSLTFDPTWAAKMLPKSVVAHGWLLFEESKMSKSRGNIVRTETILDAFGDAYLNGIREHNARELKKDPTYQSVADPTEHERDLFATDVLRYFLLREIPFGQDGSFSFDSMITGYNADLTNGYGNNVSRILKGLNKHGGVICKRQPDFWSTAEEETYRVRFREESQRRAADSTDGKDQRDPKYIREEVMELADSVAQRYRLHEYRELISLWQSKLTKIDGFLTRVQPWRYFTSLDQHEQRTAREAYYTAAESIRILTALLYPILPYATAKVWAQLGLGSIEDAAARGDLRNLQWGGLQPGTKLGPLAPIFPRAPKELAQTMADIEAQKNAPADLTNVANAEHDASTTNPTQFRQAPLASTPAGTPDQPLAAEAAGESSPNRPGAPSMAQPHRDMGGNVGGPSIPASTSPAAPPRPTSQSTNPIAEVGGSTATTPSRPDTLPHTEAQPSGIFAGTPTSGPTDGSPQITIDDFAKIELRIARVTACDRVPKADKLLRLDVDLGFETRQILSGIAEFYTPEDMVGRRIIVITNLAPRKMRGLDSHGMLLAASGPPDGPDGGKPILATVPEGVPIGTRLK